MGRRYIYKTGTFVRTFKSTPVKYSTLLVKNKDSDKLIGELVITCYSHGDIIRRFRQLTLPFTYDGSSLGLDIINSYESPATFMRYDSHPRLKNKGEELTGKRKEFLDLILNKLLPRFQSEIKDAKPVTKEYKDGRYNIKFRNYFSSDICDKLYREGSVGYSLSGKTIRITPEDQGLRRIEKVEDQIPIFISTPMRH